MARIVLGLASPHAFGGGSPEARAALRQKDETDRRINYGELLKRAPDLRQELVEEEMQRRHDASQAGVNSVAQLLQELAPDLLVVVGDDQYEQFQDENMPVFCVYRGETLPTERVRSASRRTGSQAWSSPLWEKLREERTVAALPRQPAAPALAEHVVRYLINEGFDIAVSKEMKEEVGLGHAFSFVYRKLLPRGGLPMLPIMVNTFFPPNQPTPQRCYSLGQALRRAIESWDDDKTVAVLASGGLSHVVIDEALDHTLLHGILTKDEECLCSLPAERMNLGSSELRNWVVVAGAMEPMEPEIILDYMPMYRTPAGTGNGCAIVAWHCPGSGVTGAFG
jgi:3-O-methylgallate 3,4-dioxygenase